MSEEVHSLPLAGDSGDNLSPPLRKRYRHRRQKRLYLSRRNEKRGAVQPDCTPHGSQFKQVNQSYEEEEPLVASVEERIIDIVAEQLGVNKDQITRDTSFVN